LDGSIGSSEVLDDVELEGDCESVGEVPSIPLFLHLTATVRAKKEVASQSLDALPTCLGDLLACISGSERNSAIAFSFLILAVPFFNRIDYCLGFEPFEDHARLSLPDFPF